MATQNPSVRDFASFALTRSRAELPSTNPQCGERPDGAPEFRRAAPPLSVSGCGSGGSAVAAYGGFDGLIYRNKLGDVAPPLLSLSDEDQEVGPCDSSLRWRCCGGDQPRSGRAAPPRLARISM